MAVNRVFTTPYIWSLSHVNGFRRPFPQPFLNRVFTVFQRALALVVGLMTLPFTWAWYQLGCQLAKSSSHRPPTIPPSISHPPVNRSRLHAVPRPVFPPPVTSSVSTLEGLGALETVQRSPDLKPALQSLAQALDPNDDIICDDVSLSRYFSQLPLDLSGKKIVIFCKDLGGFGDYMFGLKMLDILQQSLTGITVALATDRPGKALKLNEDRATQILMYEENCELPLTQVASLIHQFSCDFLIIAPVTWTDLSPLQSLMDTRPHLSIREYGFTNQNIPYYSPNDYVSGPTKPLVGMLVHEPLMRWAAQKEDRIACLNHLNGLPEEVRLAILQQNSIEDFARNSLLFGCYSSLEETKLRFIFSIVTEFYKHLKTDQELCFFFFSPCLNSFVKLLNQYQSILKKLNISSIELNDLTDNSHHVIALNQQSRRKIRCIFSPLQPSDAIQIFMASEKEMQTTGDQSWSEGVSANKHWIQERLIHKAECLKGILDLSEQLAREEQGPFIRLNEHLQKIYARQRYNLVAPLVGYENSALFLAESRQSTELAQAWDILNQRLLENNIRQWVVGKIVWKVLEKAYPHEFKDLQGMVGRTLKGEELQRFFQNLSRV